MTTEERFERMEHVMAGLAENLRNDREESQQLLRDTQCQIDEIAVHLNDLTLKIANTNEAINRLAEESRRAADQQLQERIESLVSAIGKLLAK